MKRAERIVEFWPWLPRQGKPPVPVGVMLLLLALGLAAILLFTWLVSGLPGSSPQYG